MYNTTVNPFEVPNITNMNAVCDNDLKNPDFLKDAMIEDHKDVGITLTSLASKCEDSMRWEGSKYTADY